MIFGNPRMLWLLLVIPPAMLGFFWWAAQVRARLVTQFIQARLLPGLTVGVSRGRQRFRAGCLVFSAAALIVALARPQWGFDWEETRQRGLDIVVAIDTSKSMLAEDIAPNRLKRAKLAALDLMQQAKSDRLGLVVFAGVAFLQCPLTVDDVAFRQSVDALDVNTLPQGGTAIASAIETALTAFKEGDNYKVLVLFTDGEDHDSGALEEAKKAAQAGLRIYTIGVGTAEGELLRVKDGQGRTDFIRDEQGNVVKSHLNEELLQEIARATEGGFYLPLRGAKTMDSLYQQALAKLPKSEHEAKLVKRYHERYHWPLAAALLLLITEMLFPERKPETPRTKLSKKVLQTAAALWLVCLVWPGSTLGSPSSALREYKAGKYDQALKDYLEMLQRKGDDPRLHFNAGAAAYRNQQFDEAAKQFNEALASPDLKLQGLSYYNRGNTLFHLGEKATEPAKRNEAWEKAIKDYESSLKLDPQDADAKFNRDYVKKLLEELKQQQQQQQQKNDQNKSDQQKNQDQQQQQQQQAQKQDKQDQSQKEQQQNSQAQQNQADQKQDQGQQQQQQARQDKKDEQEKNAAQAQEQKQQKDQKEQQQARASAAKKDKADENDAQESTSAAGEMTPQQARQLLDAQKDEEKLLPPNPTQKPTDRNRQFKDW